MACGCKKKKPIQPTNVSTPQTINTTVAESNGQTLTESQKVIVDKIVDRISQINKES